MFLVPILNPLSNGVVQVFVKGLTTANGTTAPPDSPIEQSFAFFGGCLEERHGEVVHPRSIFSDIKYCSAACGTECTGCSWGRIVCLHLVIV